MRHPVTIVRLAVLAAGAVTGLAGGALAEPTFVSGTATIIHTGHLGGAADVRSVDIPSIPAFNSTLYQLPSGTITNGTASSSARAGIGYIISSNYVGLVFPTGTNLTQRGNSNAGADSASSLEIDFSAFFHINNTTFGPGVQAGASFGLTGNIPTGGTAFDQLEVSCAFDLVPAGGGSVSLRPPIAPSPFFFRSAPGLFNFSLANLVNTVPGSIAAGDTIHVSGSVRFRVHNDVDEASIETTEVSGVPVPGAAGLLAMAGLLAARRRR